MTGNRAQRPRTTFILYNFSLAMVMRVQPFAPARAAELPGEGTPPSLCYRGLQRTRASPPMAAVFAYLSNI